MITDLYFKDSLQNILTKKRNAIFLFWTWDRRLRFFFWSVYKVSHFLGPMGSLKI